MTMDGPGTRIVQLIDLTDTRTNPDGKLIRNEQEVPLGEMCYFASPYDMPMYLRFWRRLTDRSKGKSATMDNHGVTAEMDCYPWGVKLYVRFDRSEQRNTRGKLTFILEDGDGREVMATYE